MPVNDGAFSLQRRIYRYIRNGALGIEVLDELLPNGQPHLYEKQMWDYKDELPVLAIQARPNDAELARHNAKMAEIVKDAVALYNSFGGYLMIGIKDNPRSVTGFSKQFNSEDLNKRILAATKHHVDCHFVLLGCATPEGTKTVGLLFIPQRSESREPAQFLRDAPENDNGRRAYRKHDIYLRIADECRPAHSSEDYTFLCSQGRRQYLPPEEMGLTAVLSNNLGPRDPGFIEFIGREQYLRELWRWLCDRFSPGKLLAGLGGVGKTTIAREFAEAIARSAPMGFETVIWLSAKKQYYASILGKYMPTTRVDFHDVETMLRAILLELGSTKEMISEQWTREELLDEAINALRIIPSFLVIDDVDSLEPEQQHEVFHTALQLMGQTMSGTNLPSRALLTARLDLGAAPAQLITVRGLEPKEFKDYVAMTADTLGLQLNLNQKRSGRFHKITDGSPTFASSILRLLQMGESLEAALDKWQGSDGEEVRAFAFQRELRNLNESQIRTLYAACVLGETSLVELQQITKSSATLLRDDIGELRAYHLLALGNEIPRGGARLFVPSGIRLMGDLIRTFVRDPNRVEAECAKARAGVPRLPPEVATVEHQVIALWRDDKPQDALELVLHHTKKAGKISESPDLQCLLGRAYLRLPKTDARQADAAFRKAYDLDCRRTELIPLWLETKQLLGDWIGIIEVTCLADKNYPSADNVYARAKAYAELASIAIRTNNLPSAAEHYRDAGKDIDRAFRDGHARGRVTELNELRTQLFASYVEIIDRLSPERSAHLEVWLAVGEAFAAFVRRPALIKLGVQRLRTWWEAVEERRHHDMKAANLLHTQLERLRQMQHTLARKEPPIEGLISDLDLVERILRARLEKYEAAAAATI